MVDVIAIHADLSSEEIGKPALDERVLNVMREVPRHLFVPAALAAAAYQDMPLPIGFDKTISQPFMVALMTDLLNLESGDEVLEVGAGLAIRRQFWRDLQAGSGASRSSKSSSVRRRLA